MSHLPWSWIWKVWSLSKRILEKERFEKWSLEGSQSHLFASYCTRKTSPFHIQSLFPALHLPFSMLSNWNSVQCISTGPHVKSQAKTYFLQWVPTNQRIPISPWLRMILRNFLLKSATASLLVGDALSITVQTRLSSLAVQFIKMAFYQYYKIYICNFH